MIATMLPAGPHNPHAHHHDEEQFNSSDSSTMTAFPEPSSYSCSADTNDDWVDFSKDGQEGDKNASVVVMQSQSQRGGEQRLRRTPSSSSLCPALSPQERRRRRRLRTNAAVVIREDKNTTCATLGRWQMTSGEISETWIAEEAFERTKRDIVEIVATVRASVGDDSLSDLLPAADDDNKRNSSEVDADENKRGMPLPDLSGIEYMRTASRLADRDRRKSRVLEAVLSTQEEQRKEKNGRGGKTNPIRIAESSMIHSRKCREMARARGMADASERRRERAVDGTMVECEYYHRHRQQGNAKEAQVAVAAARTSRPSTTARRRSSSSARRWSAVSARAAALVAAAEARNAANAEQQQQQDSERQRELLLQGGRRQQGLNIKEVVEKECSDASLRRLRMKQFEKRRTRIGHNKQHQEPLKA